MTDLTAPRGPAVEQQLVDELLVLLPDLLHDWTVLAEFDGAYALQRCRVCRTEVVR